MMTFRNIFLVLLLTYASVVSAQESGAAKPYQHNLMPVPVSVQFTTERLAVDSSFKVAVRGHSDARLQSAIARFVKRLEGRTVLSFQPGLALADQTATLIVHCEGPGKEIPALGENESYRIDITSRQAVLSAPTVVGALRGLETVLQLLDTDRMGYFLSG
ncbi:MAG TPA: beta-N-acetylhexosaminidase family protein, partial [Pyrinomonadaceae bacterium]|nr:beta-N-acetylhexosaminidase family protein [Pyrinomonadaceae bacterium]